MSTRHIALAVTLLAIVFLTHAAGRFTQMGGAQIAVSSAIYIFMALLLASELDWGPLVGIGLAVGVLTMLATSSPFPAANIPGHGIGFLLACTIVKIAAPRGTEVPLVTVLAMVLATQLVSWTIFATVTWIGLSGTTFVTGSFARLGLDFGHGYVAWWLAGFVGVGIPTLVAALIVTPLLYYTLRPTLIRQGVLATSAGLT